MRSTRPSSLDEVIGRSDVIYWTRVQEERFEDKADYEAIAGDFVMTPDVLAKAADDAILMHPLPRKHEMGTEADHAVLDNDPRASTSTRCRTACTCAWPCWPACSARTSREATA